jgi:hypothetical protein
MILSVGLDEDESDAKVQMRWRTADPLECRYFFVGKEVAEEPQPSLPRILPLWPLNSPVPSHDVVH